MKLQNILCAQHAGEGAASSLWNNESIENMESNGKIRVWLQQNVLYTERWGDWSGVEYRELIPGKVYCFPSKTPYQITQHSAGLEGFYVHMDSASFVYVREFIQAFKDRKSEFNVWYHPQYFIRL